MMEGVKVARALLMLVACFLASAAQAQVAPSRNLIENGGFEDGLTGWQPEPQHILIKEKRLAHTGDACLFGEVTEPRRALRLLKTVPVKMGKVYEFEAWIRATNNTKFVLWVRQPGADKTQRQMVAALEDVPSRWTQFKAIINPERSGDLVLEIVAPSSHAAPPGKMWIDDIALYEVTPPTLLNITEDRGFNDEPTMAQAADGSLYVAWISFRDGADSLQVARYQHDKTGFIRLGAWQVIGGNKTYVLQPQIVADGDNLALLYSAEVNGNWDIFCAPLTSKGPGQPLAIASHPGVDIKPAGAWHEGTLWLAWESNRNGSRQIFVSAMRQGRTETAEPVSDSQSSNYNPSIAVLASGEVCVAWHSFRHNNFDIYLRRRTSEGWGTEQRLTSAPSIDRHPVLFTRGQELWLIYENALTKGYRVGATTVRRLIVAKIEPQGLLAPRELAKSPLYGHCENPAVAFDPEGRLWIAHLRPRLPKAGWDTFLICLTGSQCLAPMRVSMHKGLDRRPSLALKDRQAFVVFQSDNIPSRWPDEKASQSGKSNIFLASVDIRNAPPAGEIELAPLVEPGEPFEAAELRLARGEDTAPVSIEYQGQTLKLFYGNLHEHTDVSPCNRIGDQSIDESYQAMRDITRHDFACATDHGYGMNAYLWNYTAKMARVNYDPGRFLTFLAEEWTSTFEKYNDKHPYGYYGHRNLILADPYFPRWWNAFNGQTPAQVWEDLRKMKANFVHIPHQLADTGNVPIDWSFTDETAQPVAEIFQTRGSYEYKGAPREAKRTTPKGWFLQDAWARGIVIGVIASPDHGGGMGKACVYAPELTRAAILDALRTRHCYGTTAAKIALDVRVNGHLMGEKIPAPNGKPVQVKISVRCPAEIARVEVCRNNEFIYTKECRGLIAELVFNDTNPPTEPCYYYVRIQQKDGEIAWSSPVWLGAP